MGFSVPKEGGILSETEMTEFFEWRHERALHGHILPPEIERLVPKIGARTSDDTVYAGISPDSNKPMFTTPEDGPLTYTFNDAADYATKLNLAESNPDKRTWHVPTKNELNVLFQNRAAIGGFNETCSDLAGWHWSSRQVSGSIGWGQDLRDGLQLIRGRHLALSLRCVR